MALDADGVLYDFVGGMLRYLETRWGVGLHRSEIKTPVVTQWTARPMVNADLGVHARSPGLFGDLETISGTPDAVARLCKVAHVHLITARPISTRGATAASVARWFPGISDIHHTRNKAQIAKKLRVKYAVEDHIPTALEYVNSKVKVWVVRYPFTGPIPRSRFISDVDTPVEAIDDIIQKIKTVEGT